MQMYGHGLRRRTAPMLGGDGPRLRMAWSLMFSPARHAGGVLRRRDRHGREPRHRRPHEPCACRCSGRRRQRRASRPRRRRARPPAAGRRRSAPATSTSPDQRRDPDSLLNWIERLDPRAARAAGARLGHGDADRDRRAGVFAHRCDWEGGTVIAVHNLGARAGERRARARRRTQGRARPARPTWRSARARRPADRRARGLRRALAARATVSAAGGSSVRDLQAFLRTSAQRAAKVLRVAPFTVTIHPDGPAAVPQLRDPRRRRAARARPDRGAARRVPGARPAAAPGVDRGGGAGGGGRARRRGDDARSCARR